MRRERSGSGKRQAELDERAEAKRYEVLRVREAQSAGKSPAAMAGALKLQDWQLRRVLSAAARADDAFLRYAVQACADVDLRLKSVACEPYAAVGTLLARLQGYGRARKSG